MAILISTPQDLDNIRNDLYGTYELANNIDMSSYGNWTPINDFGGVLDGKGFIIENLTIDGLNGYAGLFGNVSSYVPSIRNLGLENINYTNIGGSYNGGLVGRIYNGLVENCYVTGTITTLTDSGTYVGGLIGLLHGGTIRNSYTKVNVIGYNNLAGFISRDNSGLIENCYSIGLVKQHDGSNGNGFVHNGWSEVKNSYWDIETSGTTTSGSGTGLTTAEMKTQSSYVNWDFTNIWEIDEGVSYPTLQVFASGMPEPLIETREVNSYIPSIQCHTERHIASFRNVEGYSSPIHSNVTTDVISGNREVRNVSSYINTLNSNVVTETHRQPLLVTRNVTSHIRPIQANIDVLTPLDTLPIMATISVLENDSMAFNEQNLSNISYMNNPSYVEVVK